MPTGLLPSLPRTTGATALALLAVGGASAHAAPPARLPHFRGYDGDASVTVLADGRAGVVYSRRGDGAGAYFASLRADGRLARVDRVPTPRLRSGPDQVTLRLGPDGAGVASFVGYLGRRRAGGASLPGATGFELLPFTARLGWGSAPQRAQALQTGRVNASVGDLQLALAPDGTAAATWLAAPIDGADDAPDPAHAALLPPDGPPVARALPELDGRDTVGVFPRADGGFESVWGEVRDAGDGTYPYAELRKELAATGDGVTQTAAAADELDAAFARADDAGDLVRVVKAHESAHTAPRSPIRLYVRPAGAAAYAPAQTVARGRGLAGWGVGAAGHAAVLLERPAKGHLGFAAQSLRLRDPRGTLSREVRLPGHEYFQDDDESTPRAVAVAADGSVLVGDNPIERGQERGRLVRVDRRGRVTVLRTFPSCMVRDVAVAPTGAGAAVLACHEHAEVTGAVATVAASAGR